jgi:hypothetical protein
MKKYTLILLVINIFTIEIAAQNTAQRTQQREMDSEIVVEAIPDQVYTGAAITPNVVIKDGQKTLVKGTDYVLTYSNNKEIGKATVTIQGKGNYSDTKDVYFNIVAKSLQISPIPDQTYRGALITPAVVVKDGTKTLQKDRDYTVTYANNLNVGTATITITGKGTYTEKKEGTFKIVAKSMKDSRATTPARQSSSNSATTQTVQQTQQTQQTEQQATETSANAGKTRQTFNRRIED